MMLQEHENLWVSRGGGRAFDPEVVAIMGFAFGAVYADLGRQIAMTSCTSSGAAITELAAVGERDPVS